MRARNKRWLVLSAAGFVLATWVALGQQPRRVDDLSLRNSGRTGEEWLTYGLTPQETRYSPLKQIDTTNVSRLGLAWSYDVGQGGGTQEATPLMYNGNIYGITNWRKMAMGSGSEPASGATENLLWRGQSRSRNLPGQDYRSGD